MKLSIASAVIIATLMVVPAVAAVDDAAAKSTNPRLLQGRKKPFNKDSICFDPEIQDDNDAKAIIVSSLDDKKFFKSIDKFLLSASISACVRTFCDGLEFGSAAQTKCIDYCDCTQTHATATSLFQNKEGLIKNCVDAAQAASKIKGLAFNAQDAQEECAFTNKGNADKCNAIGCFYETCSIKFDFQAE